jgi:hypothetical protein
VWCHTIVRRISAVVSSLRSLACLDRNNLYVDCPSRQLKVKVADRTVVQPEWDEMRLIQPVALQVRSYRRAAWAVRLAYRSHRAYVHVVDTAGEDRRTRGIGRWAGFRAAQWHRGRGAHLR